jgi:hypothetical protein
MIGAIGGVGRPAAGTHGVPAETASRPVGQLSGPAGRLSQPTDRGDPPANRLGPDGPPVQSGDLAGGERYPSAAADESVWPDESAEAAFLAERRSGEEGSPSEAGRVVRTGPAAGQPLAEEKETLPPLDDLVPRIPGEVRAALEDLFRAKFVTVRRMPKEALKS